MAIKPFKTQQNSSAQSMAQKGTVSVPHGLRANAGTASKHNSHNTTLVLAVLILEYKLYSFPLLHLLFTNDRSCSHMNNLEKLMCSLINISAHDACGVLNGVDCPRYCTGS